MDWSDKWLLRFNPTKCKVMHIGHNYDTRYSIEGEKGRVDLSAVTEEKDLGVYVTNDLKSGT